MATYSWTYNGSVTIEPGKKCGFSLSGTVIPLNVYLTSSSITVTTSSGSSSDLSYYINNGSISDSTMYTELGSGMAGVLLDIKNNSSKTSVTISRIVLNLGGMTSTATTAENSISGTLLSSKSIYCSNSAIETDTVNSRLSVSGIWSTAPSDLGNGVKCFIRAVSNTSSPSTTTGNSYNSEWCITGSSYDIIQVPEGIPAGTYNISIGIYSFATSTSTYKGGNALTRTIALTISPTYLTNVTSKTVSFTQKIDLPASALTLSSSNASTYFTPSVTVTKTYNNSAVSTEAASIATSTWSGSASISSLGTTIKAASTQTFSTLTWSGSSSYQVYTSATSSSTRTINFSGTVSSGTRQANTIEGIELDDITMSYGNVPAGGGTVYPTATVDVVYEFTSGDELTQEYEYIYSASDTGGYIGSLIVDDSTEDSDSDSEEGGTGYGSLNMTLSFGEQTDSTNTFSVTSSNGGVTGTSEGTTEYPLSNRRSVVVSYSGELTYTYSSLSYSSKISTQTKTVYQAANILTWDTPVISCTTPVSLSAAGQTYTATPTITQSGTYTSGSSASNTSATYEYSVYTSKTGFTNNNTSGSTLSVTVEQNTSTSARNGFRVRITATTANDKTGTKIVTFNQPGLSTSSLAISMSGYTYGGTKSTPSVTTNTSGGTVTYYYNTTDSTSGGTEWSKVTSSTYLNAGTYYMYATVPITGSYYSATSATVSFTISKATPTLSVTLATGLTYNGSARSLVTATSVTGDGQVYTGIGSSSTSAPSSWSTWSTSCTGTSAGTYYVWAKADASTNYNAVSAKYIGTVTIGKASWSLSTFNTTGAYTYNGSVKGTFNVKSPLGGTVYFSTSSISASTSYSTSVSANTATTYTNADLGYTNYTTGVTRYARGYQTGNSNYNAWSNQASTTIVINKRTVTITAPSCTSSTLTYTGSAQTLSSGGSCTTGGTMYYYVSTSSSTPSFSTSSWSTSNPTGTAAGTYYTWYYCYVSDTTNNTGTGINTVTICCNGKTIGKATLTYTAPTAKGGTYAGSAVSLFNAGSCTGGTIYYYASTTNSTPALSSITSTSISTGLPKEDSTTGYKAQTYYLWYKIVADGNHTGDVGVTSLGSAVVNPGTITVTKVPYSGTYDGSSHNASIKTNISGCTVESGSSSGTYEKTDSTSTTANTAVTLTAVSRTNAGSYIPGSSNVYYRVSKNYYTTVKDQTSVTIVPIESHTVTIYTSSTGSGTISTGGSRGAITYLGTGTTYPACSIAGSWTVSSGNTSYITISSPTGSSSTSADARLAVTCYGAKSTIDAGITVTITANFTPSSTNYGKKTVTWTHTVTKGTPSFTNFTNPSAQTYKTSGTYSFTLGATVNSGGTISYSSSITVKNGSTTVSGWTISDSTVTVPEGTNAGTYTVTGSVGVAETPNYRSLWDTSHDWTITISKAEQPMTISASRSTIYNTSGYNTSQITPSNNQGSVSYSIDPTSIATISSTGLVTYVSAGTATVTVTAAGNTNYNSGSKTLSIECVVDTETSYDSLSGTIVITQIKNFPAGGVTLSSSNIGTYFSYSTPCTQVVHLTSGGTKTLSGTDISYSWNIAKGNTIPSLGTTETTSVTSRTISFSVMASSNGKSTSTSVTSGNQEANNVVSLSLSLNSPAVNTSSNNYTLNYNSSATTTVSATYTSGDSDTFTKATISSGDTSIATVS